MKAILHCDRKWGIGRFNTLMFRLPEDMKFFRETTSGKVVVMGSNTLLSLPGGKPLKNRTNIVLWPGGDKTRAASEGYTLADGLDELKTVLAAYPPDDVYVMGGAMMYRTLLPYCSHVLVTKVDADGDADTFFPDLDALPDWSLESESAPVEDNGYTIRFCTYVNAAPLGLEGES